VFCSWSLRKEYYYESDAKIGSEWVTAKAFHARTGADIYCFRIGNVIDPVDYEKCPAYFKDLTGFGLRPVGRSWRTFSRPRHTFPDVSSAKTDVMS